MNVLQAEKSIYYNQMISINNDPRANDWNKLPRLIGVVDSLLRNIKKGYLKSLEEIIHGDVFSDFLEMGIS